MIQTFSTSISFSDRDAAKSYSMRKPKIPTDQKTRFISIHCLEKVLFVASFDDEELFGQYLRSEKNVAVFHRFWRYVCLVNAIKLSELCKK